MGGVAVLHPQDCLKDHRDGLFSTPVKSRRSPKSSVNYSSSTPNLTRYDGRKRSPPTRVRKNNRTTAAMVVDQPKHLVMGQVKILKRGEALDESSTVLKDMNDRKVSNGTVTTPPKDVAGDRKVFRDLTGARRVLLTKKKPEKEKKSCSNPSLKVDALKVDDLALSSTDRLGPDPEMVSKQMKKNIAEFFFAGSPFVDSPPPSSLPLPGFFTKNFVDPSTDLRRMLGLSLS
ncbi:uncharacterized protein LOC112528057 [Cynara cardunculus var. scolymus]|uniref:uncharacterized protein LOC112528057 n=1 Tax=Cynara cardunculus var. scolymus TaxID=59895 RepID=UPI000D623E2A|nr:uncharacterized protein LOC112528057 [Cynara cardunculus var. scolymus]